MKTHKTLGISNGYNYSFFKQKHQHYRINGDFSNLYFENDSMYLSMYLRHTQVYTCSHIIRYNFS